MRALCVALVAFAACASVPTVPSAEHALPFIEDDFPKALALARERRVPVLVDAWAPW